MPALQIIALDTATPRLRAPASGDTYSAPRAVDITPESLTGSVATSSLSITQTWNTTGTPTAIDLNVTDTASNASSLLMNLRVGGSSKLSVDKNGRALSPLNSNSIPALATSAASDRGFGFYGNRPSVLYGTNVAWSWPDAQTMSLGSTSRIVWTSGNPIDQAADLILTRDAANTLAQRNGVNAQEKRVYGTYTDASNHRRVAMGMSASGVGFIRPEGAGTGATGNVLHISGLPTSNPGPGILWNNAGSVAIGT